MLCLLHRWSQVQPLSQTFTNAWGHVYKYMVQKGMVTILPSTQSVGVTPEVNLKIMQVRKQTERVPHWLQNPGQISAEIQNWDILNIFLKMPYFLPDHSARNTTMLPIRKEAMTPVNLSSITIITTKTGLIDFVTKKNLSY